MDRLDAAILAALETDELRQKLRRRRCCKSRPSTPRSSERRIKQESGVWEQFVRGRPCQPLMRRDLLVTKYPAATSLKESDIADLSFIDELDRNEFIDRLYAVDAE